MIHIFFKKQNKIIQQIKYNYNYNMEIIAMYNFFSLFKIN